MNEYKDKQEKKTIIRTMGGNTANNSCVCQLKDEVTPRGLNKCQQGEKWRCKPTRGIKLVLYNSTQNILASKTPEISQRCKEEKIPCQHSGIQIMHCQNVKIQVFINIFKMMGSIRN